MVERKIINIVRKKKLKDNWNDIWSTARIVYENAGMHRQKATLDNFVNQKEEICRVMGIISLVDLKRIQSDIDSKTKG